MSSAQVSQVVESFLRDLLGAKKATRLYPPGNPLAADWVHRLHRSLEAGTRAGLPKSLRLVAGRFEWDGGHLMTRDPLLEAFRFELQTRRVTEIAIDATAEPWELEQFLHGLNLAPHELEAAGGLASLLQQKNVVNIAVGDGFLRSGGPLAAIDVGSADDLAPAALVGLEQLADVIGRLLGAELAALAYNRQRLADWLAGLAGPEGRPEGVFAAVKSLIPVVDAEPDREGRYRVLAEVIVALPDAVRGHLVSSWLFPRLGTDPELVALLIRFSQDELATLLALAPAGILDDLRTRLDDLPGDASTIARLRERLQDAGVQTSAPTSPFEPLISNDDPEFLALRESVRGACAPNGVLVQSVRVLFRLLAEGESPSYPVFLVDALEEAAAEALARSQLSLVFHILTSLGEARDVRPEWHAEHQQRLHLFHRRLAGRPNVSLLADLVRRTEQPTQVRDAAEYLRVLGREAVEEYLAVLAEETDARRRARMLEVVEALGPSAVPALRPWISDSRWAIARTMVSLLARIGGPAALQVLEKATAHKHAQVRREVARALAAVGGKLAMRPLLEFLGDPDPEVRLSAIKLLGTLMDADAVEPLQQFLTKPTRTASDLLVKRRIIAALVTIGGQEARHVLESIAHRRVWPWQRSEAKVRERAAEALRSMGQAPTAVQENDRGR